MLMTDVIAEIQAGIGYRGDKIEAIKRKLVLAQDELERGRTLPSFIVLENQSIPLAEGNGVWTLPSNFIREVDDFGDPSSTNLDVYNLSRVSYDVGVSRYSGLSGTPMSYARRATSLVFFPTPDADITLSISYYAKQDSPLSASTNAWSENAPLLLIGLAGMMIASDLEHTTAEAKFARQYALARESVFKEIVASEDANQSYSLGGGL